MTAMYIKISLVSCFLVSYLFCDKDRAVTKACLQTGGLVFMKQKCVAGRVAASKSSVIHLLLIYPPYKTHPDCRAE